jgi:hypothetical protein
MGDSDFSDAGDSDDAEEERQFSRLRKKSSTKSSKRQSKVGGTIKAETGLSKEARNTADIAKLLKRKGSAIVDLSTETKGGAGGASKRPRSSSNSEPTKRREFKVTGNGGAGGSGKISKRPGVKTSRAGGPRVVFEDSLQFFHRKLCDWDLGLNPVTAETKVCIKMALLPFSFSHALLQADEVVPLKVPDQFKSFDHYLGIWRPMCVMEVRAQIINSVGSEQDAKIAMPMRLSHADQHAKKTDVFHFLQCTVLKSGSGGYGKGGGGKGGDDRSDIDHRMSANLMMNDLILLSNHSAPPSVAEHKPPPAPAAENGHKKKRQHGQEYVSKAGKYALAVVNSPKRSHEGLQLKVSAQAWRSMGGDHMYGFKVRVFLPRL